VGLAAVAGEGPREALQALQELRHVPRLARLLGLAHRRPPGTGAESRVGKGRRQWEGVKVSSAMCRCLARLLGLAHRGNLNRGRERGREGRGQDKHSQEAERTQTCRAACQTI